MVDVLNNSVKQCDNFGRVVNELMVKRGIPLLQMDTWNLKISGFQLVHVVIFKFGQVDFLHCALIIGACFKLQNKPSELLLNCFDGYVRAPNHVLGLLSLLFVNLLDHLRFLALVILVMPFLARPWVTLVEGQISASLAYWSSVGRGFNWLSTGSELHSTWDISKINIFLELVSGFITR